MNEQTPLNTKRFDELMDAILEGAATPEQVALFNACLRRDVNARARYIAYMDLHAALADPAGPLKETSQDDVPNVMSELVEGALAARRQHEIEHEANQRLAAQQAEDDRFNRRRLRYHAAKNKKQGIVIPTSIAWLGIAAALGLVALVIYQLSPSTPTQIVPPPIVDHSTERAPVFATVVRTLDAHWRDGRNAWSGEFGLREGRHVLSQGLVEIELADGARVILEAPVSFELTGTNAMKLSRGRLVANVPPAAIGFIVDTPSARIIDYGTEFGVTSDLGQIEAVVFEGEVSVQPMGRADGALGAAPPSIRLSRAQYAFIDPAGELVTGEVASGEVNAMYLRSLDPQTLASWRYAKAVLESKPLIYWGMQELSSHKVINSSAIGNRYDGLIEGVVRGDGGIGGQYAQFGASASASLITLDGPLRELSGSNTYTIECWARIDRYHRGVIANLFVDPANMPNSHLLDIMHLEVIDALRPTDSNGSGRVVRFTHRDTPSNQGGQQLYSTPYQLDVWIHLVCVKRGSDITLYIDGNLAAQSTSDLPVADVPYLVVGLLYGNRGEAGEGDLRALHGGLDEFALYRQALDAADIRRHYAMGVRALDMQ